MIAESQEGQAVGIDAGASKTVGVLVNANCSVIERVVTGGSNVRSVGLARASQNIGEIVHRLSAGGRVRAVCIGAAGIDREEDRRVFEDMVLRQLGEGTSLALRHDAQIALNTATNERPAVVVVAGTGSLVYGERADGTSERAGGYGAIIGDAGSGYAIGLAGIHHAARALDGVETRGVLADSVIGALGAKTARDIIRRIHTWPPDISAIANLAPLVGDGCNSGDAAALAIANTQASLLADLAVKVIAAVRVSSSLAVILSGGAYQAVPLLSERIRQAAQYAGPCDVRRLMVEPVLGAARIAVGMLKAAR